MVGTGFWRCNLFFMVLCGISLSAAVPVADGLLFHAAADNLAGYNQADPVSMWPDLSGNDNHAFQNDSGHRPVYISNALNGKPVLRFDGVNDYFSLPELPEVGTVFVVLREDPNATHNWRPFISHALPGNEPANWHRGENRTFWSQQWGQPVVYEGQTKVNGVIVNGLTTPIPTSYALVSQINLAPVPANLIGRDRSFSDRVWHGDIAEILLYNRALNEQEENAVGWYLAHKYNLASTYAYPGLRPVYPPLQALGVPRTDLQLSWWTVPQADSYRVYFGRSLPLPVAAVVSEPVMAWTTALEPQTTYFWQVEALRDGDVVETGDIWSFRTAGPWQDCPPADLTGDCAVGLDDLLVLASEWLEPEPTPAVNLDGRDGVDMRDFAILSEYWGQRIDGAIIISEFMARNRAAVPLRPQDVLDEDGDASDWIELYNTTNRSISLKDWYLTDDQDDLTQWQFPDVALPAGGYLVVFASGKDRTDPDAPLHTNFSLAAAGEYLALVYPDGQTIAHTYGVYPVQFTNISYGISEAGAAAIETTTLLAEGAPAKAFIPSSSALGDSWRYYDFDDQSWLTGATGVGYEANPNDPIHYADLIGLDVSAMRGANTTVYIRIPFEVDEPQNISQLRFLMRYDDGFIAWLNGVEIARANAPETPAWNSRATQQNLDEDAVIPEVFDGTLAIEHLRRGTNLLAIQGLNSSLNSSDLLILPEVESLVMIPPPDEMLEGYFSVPTPGRPNYAADLAIGPAITPLEENPPRPEPGENLIITAKIAQHIDPVADVTLHGRRMFQPEVQFPMRDDGVWPDETAGDGIYTVQVPIETLNPGEMVRWYFTAEDTAGRLTRDPLFPHPTDSPQYYGTVIRNPEVDSQMPVFEWFVENVGASETRGGTRASIYYNGRFYDNVFIRIRGGSTAGMPKKHFKFDFNRGFNFIYDDDHPAVREININSTYSDKAYIRQPLAFEVYNLCGNPASISFPVHSRRNGEFFGISIFIEEPEEEMLQRHGLDPDGALYKVYNTFVPGGSLRKKTRTWEGRQDFDAFASQIHSLSGSERHNYIFDAVDVPRTINYLVATVLVHQNDHPHKNHYLYRDSDGSGEWFFMPWDHDLTWGSNWIGDSGGSFSDVIYAANDQIFGRDVSIKPSHPFIGKADAREWNNHWNHLIDALLNDETFREMYLRRLRTMMDSLLQPSDTPYDQRILERRIDEMVAAMEPELTMDYAKWADPWTWGGQGGYLQDQTPAMAIDILKTDYLNVRRDHLFITHHVDNAASYPIAGSYSARIPNAQPAEPTVIIGQIEYNPASFNQDEEFIQLINPNPYAVDISGWHIRGAVEHTFRPGTVIASENVMYVSPDVAAFRNRNSSPTGGQGLFVQGNYKGRLSNRGDTVELIDQTGRLVDGTTYEGNPSDAQRVLRITELMYNPSPADVSGWPTQDYEYVELTNIGEDMLPLAGVRFSDGIYFTFPADAQIASGEYIVLAKNPDAFRARYTVAPNTQVFGGYDGQLSNSGERITLVDHTGDAILDFVYSDQWYPATDGLGYALVFWADLHGHYTLWNEKAYWRAGVLRDGTPGRAEPNLRLMHYWSFNDTLLPTYSLDQAEMMIAPGPTTEVATGTGQDFEGLNNRLDEPTGAHLRINNPLGAAMTLRLATTGYEDIVLSYETRRSGQGAGVQVISYSIDGVNFEPFRTIAVFDAAPELHQFDFTHIAGVADNPYFAVRIEFEQGDGGTAGNNRFDNITLDGVPLTGTNQPPQLTEPLPFTETIEDTPVQIDLSAYFTDPDGDELTFTAQADKPFVAEASVVGQWLTLAPLVRGDAVITITTED
ncbi:MAG TPA: hypothetical protein ENN97_01945, partial [Phycisphaerales bacterium]|nr:hypothetical protein [Phycisphaerales bacterium]